MARKSLRVVKICRRKRVSLRVFFSLFFLSVFTSVYFRVYIIYFEDRARFSRYVGSEIFERNERKPSRRAENFRIPPSLSLRNEKGNVERL